MSKSRCCLLTRGFGLLLLTLAAVWPVIAMGQLTENRLIPESTARRHGMVRSWWRQAPVDTTQDEVENLTLHGDTLYVQTKRGTISALDSETGHVRWTLQIGSPDLVTTAVGANDKYAAVANGTKLYVLAHDDGKIVLERRLKNVPGAGPALSGTHVFTPTTNGSIESYDVVDSKQPPQIYNSTGRAMNQPFSAGVTLAWTTDKGLFYVAQTDPLSPRFRVETNEPILVGPGYQHPYLYVGSIDGHVLKVHEITGNIVWKIAVGEPVDARPSVLGDRLFVSSRRGGLRCVLAEAKVEAPKPGEEANVVREGTVLWQAPSVGRLLAGSEKRLYCLDELGRMSILRRSDGGFLDSMVLPGEQLAIHNDVTDRIYIGTRSGTIQCLHEAGIDKPLKHRRETSQKKIVKEAKQKALEPKEKGKEEKDADFGKELFDDKKPADGNGGEKAAPMKEAPAAADAFGGDEKPEPAKKAPAKKEKAADADAFGG
ncbi:MAG: PQQ-binding-like beta-propeller repeat protein [Planctomycetes bacterium]|nr:PQQ-binding-like beta-propeller repeat protein [Planctomycetota bacterium]